LLISKFEKILEQIIKKDIQYREFYKEDIIMKVTDSILFLSCSRRALKEQVLKSKLEEVKRVAFSEFIMNEATDYEIMSLLVDNKLPKEKYNQEAEIQLFAEFKHMVIENYSNLSKTIDEAGLVSVIYEVGPVSIHGYSTAVPVLEFLINEQGRSGGSTPSSAAWVARSVGKKVGQLPRKAMNVAKDVGGSYSAAGKDYYSRMKNIKHKKVLGGTAAAALAAYGAVKAYQRWMSAGAKACKGKSGADRTACLQQYKQKADAAKAAAKRK
jgi:hypothetical protein